MFFVLSKLLIVLLRPLCWILALSIWALITKNAKRKRKLLLIATCILFICSNKVLVNELARAWELPPVSSSEKLPSTAVILGGYAEFDAKRNRVQLSDAADRLFSPVVLLHQKKLKKVILSGGAASLTGRLKPEADYVFPILKSLGIPDSSVLVENKSRNTFENAINTGLLLDSLKINDTILLVTSAFHMRRALGVFKKAGIKVKPYPVHFISDYGRGYFLPDWFIPSSEALFRTDALLKEWFGYFAYAVTGKL
jgi:uncharacterized SAM-binding protein YcdF (DUF218 family)